MSAAIFLGGGRRARIVTAPGRISVALVCRPYSAIRSLTPRPITAKIELPERRASMLRIPRVSSAHLALVAFVAATPATAFAQLTKAGVVTTLLGTATVSRAALSQPLPLKFKDDVFVQDRVITGDDSVARILLGGKAIVTVRERSSLTITEVPGVSTVNVGEGRAAIAVVKERMKPGETVEIRTPNAIAGIRGTIVVVEVDRVSAQAGSSSNAVYTTRFTVI